MILRALVLLGIVALVASLVLHDSDQQVLAAHHVAEISEVMSGFDGDPDVQFVEINRLTIYQNVVATTRLTAFNPDGTLAGVLLDPLGGNVNLSSGNWIMGTAAFEAAAGISADFTFAPGILPAAGMVCWGAPGTSAPAYGTWDASDPTNYVDCVSYGDASFTGTNPMSLNPNSAGAGNGQLSLTRSVTSTGKATNPWRNSDDATDFKLATPSPTNDAGELGILDGPPTTPTPTPTTTTPKDPSGDTDGDGIPNSSDPDDDNDGCTDAKEDGSNETLGGRRDAHNPNDFYDVLGAGGSPPDGVIDLPNDILGVILHFAPGGAPPYDVLYDRGPSTGPNPWNMTAPDGSIDLPNDILGVILQFGHDCR